MPDQNDSPAAAEAAAPQGKVALRVDEHAMATAYANVVLTHASEEDVMLDFGVKGVAPPQDPKQPEVVLQITNRVVMNYFSAKRLAMALSQIIRRYEDQFGEIELDAGKRKRS
ncbi:MAG: DUF3467 domain-containing protein [Planctomycetaceae bacterium]|nr:DUF3467 domain-containing protein [Planctomycetaceae bacterium]